jgi:actin-related protein
LLGDEGIDFKGTPALITETVNGCDVDVKKELYSNVLLSGGNVLYGSLIEDLLSKIGEHSPANVKVKSVSVCSPGERKHLSWIGGSIVTSLSSFQSYWVGNQEWKETGSGILDKKCI